jgi:hypothetical protein
MSFSFLSRWSLATLFHYKARIKGEPVKAVRVTNPYHSVAVVPGPGACQAARRCANQRYLSAEAPVLPLKECDAATCGCHYQHFTDRRAAPRRADDARVVRMQGVWRGMERRLAGRRVDDE